MILRKMSIFVLSRYPQMSYIVGTLLIFIKYMNKYHKVDIIIFQTMR